MYTTVTRISTGLFNTNVTTTTPDSEELELGMYTTVSRISTGLFNTNITSQGSKEPDKDMYTAVSHIFTGLFNSNMTSPGSEEPDSIVVSLCSKTCSYLLGNKGCHIYNGNTTDKPEAWLTQETLSLIKKNVDESVGYITIKSDLPKYATGFRVGDCYMMTVYHVYRQSIDQMLEQIAFEIEAKEINMEDLLRKLEITDFEVANSTEPFVILVVKILNKLMKDSATNMSLLIQKLADFIDTEAFTSKLENRWKQNCVVNFINHGQFSVDWKIEFGDQESDIIIVKLNAKAGQTLPKPMLLDEKFMDHGDIHVIRYIHDGTPKIIMDQYTQEFKGDAELRQNVEAAVQWWKTKFSDETDNFFCDCYKSCNKAHDEESGNVVLRASKSFRHGASGSPIVYSINNTGQPIVGMIFQRGYPEFYYSAQKDSKSRFHGTQVDMKNCFFEGGTTMRKAARLLEEYSRHDLKHNVFSSLREMEIKLVNIEDLKPLLHTQIAQEFVTFAAELANVRSKVQQLTAVTEIVRSEVQVVRAEMVTIRDLVDLFAQHGARFALPTSGNSRGNTTASPGSKKPTDLMDKNVEKWQTVDRDVQILADRFIQELKSDTWQGAMFIAEHRCIDEDRLISCLKTQLFDNKDVSQDMIGWLCLSCVAVVCNYRCTVAQDVSDITTWRGYKLLVMLLQGGAHCNIQCGCGCAIHLAVYCGVLPVIKLLVQYQADCINSVDEYSHSVLHYAVYPRCSEDSNIEITRYLLSLPNLTCKNQRDINNRTPYWYVVHNKRVDLLSGEVCEDCVVPHRQDMIYLYKQKGAILSDIKQ